MQLKNLKKIISDIIGIYLYKKNTIFYVLKRRNRRILLFIILTPLLLNLKHNDITISQMNKYGYIKNENGKSYYFFEDQKYEIMYNKFGELIDIEFITPIY